MTTLDKIRERKAEILALADKYGFENIRVFGSVARGDESENSDVDFLIDWDDHKEPFGRVYFMQEVEKMIGRKIDVAVAKNLHWVIKDDVLKSAKPL